MNHPVALDNLLQLGCTGKQTTKVLHLINGEHYSGAERVQDLLALALRPMGYEVGFVCLKPGRFPVERQSQGNLLHKVRMKSKFDFGFRKKLVGIIRDGDYEILHAHTPRTLLVGSLVARQLKIPLVYHVHSPVGRDSTRSLNNRLNQWVESIAAKRADHLICVSDSLQQYMQQLGHDCKRLTSVANGVAWNNEVADRNRPNGTWTLGTTALFRPRKGIEVLLESLAHLHQNDMDVRLLAVGPFESTEYQQKIQNLAADLGIADRITWTGFTNDVNQYFRQMDLFVLPSLFGEGLPMVILEAMANGVPVVAADVEGIPQAIRANIDGLIFEPGNASALSSKITEMIERRHDWNSIRNSALERQRSHFSDHSMAGGVAQVYDQILTERVR